jgi:hypothetical protein
MTHLIIFLFLAIVVLINVLQSRLLSFYQQIL